MELKQFRNKYGLELIPASHADIILGTLVWDPLIGKPDFAHPGMPGHIFNAFRDAELMTEEEFQEYLNDARNEEETEAKMAESVLEVDLGVAASLKHPLFGKVTGAFDKDKLRKFSFGNLKARVMSNLMRVRIDDYLETLKHDNWEFYDGRIRRVFMITELYYGSMKLVVDKDVKNQLETGLNNTDLEAESSVELGRSVEYTFSHNNVPFAMRLERVKAFNG